MKPLADEVRKTVLGAEAFVKNGTQEDVTDEVLLLSIRLMVLAKQTGGPNKPLDKAIVSLWLAEIVIDAMPRP